MNMTIVLVSKRSMELLLYFACLALLVTCQQSSANDGDRTEKLVSELADETRELTGDQFSSIVHNFGIELGDQVDKEMRELIAEAERRAAQSKELERVRAIERLKEANKQTSDDIKSRIDLVGDNGAALPQLSLGHKAGSFLSSASQRLQSAGSYIGNKLSSLGAYIAPKIPQRVRRFFRWPSFLKFKLRHNKHYKTLREEVYRQMLYLKSHIRVGVQHVRFWLRKDKHLLGATQYADWTSSEYHDRLANKLAERSRSEADESALASFDPKYKAKLRALEASGETLQGLRTSEMQQANHSHKAKQHHNRKKRDASETDFDGGDDDDELNYNEEDDDEDDDDDGFEDALETIQASEEDDDDLDPEKMFEEFANVQLGDLDELGSALDSAVTEKPAYDPLGDQENDEDDIRETVGDDFVPIDLRQTGCIIRPENQENCGACYAYALNAAAAYYNCMDKYHNSDKLVRYHPLYTAECGRYLTPAGQYPMINGCQGGRLSKAFQFAKLVGVQRYTDYLCARLSVGSQVPKGQCIYERPEKLDMGFSELAHQVPLFSRSRFVNMKLNEIDLHLRTVGPVFVNIRTWKDFGLMRAGIYGGQEEEDSSDPAIHSMLIVGHDKDMFNRDYWIILNSHGVNWAERGFVRLYTRSLKHFVLYVGGLQPQE